MSGLVDRTYYELLEIGTDAAPEELERAYRITRATYEEGSLATYSLYGGADLAALRERVDEAYRVLSDPEERARYDAQLTAAPEREVPFDLDLDLEEAGGVSPEVPPEIERFEPLGVDENLAWNGSRLRRARLERGIELEQVARVTKVNPTYLRCIEDDRYADLPAAVYVRGFVTAYARCIGLDPERVSRDYLDLVRPAEPDPGRGRRRRR